MKQSSAQLALDDFLWNELPSPPRKPQPEPTPALLQPACRLQRRLMLRDRAQSAQQAQEPAGLCLQFPRR